MREIKFRGKRIDNGEWVYGSLLELTTGSYIVPTYTSYNEIDVDLGQEITINALWEENDFYQVTSVGQYAGLKDKNGKEIYEGDVIIANEQYGFGEADLEYKVEYVERLAKFVFQPTIKNGKYDNNNFDLDMYFYKQESVEAISNIYDTKEEKE